VISPIFVSVLRWAAPPLLGGLAGWGAAAIVARAIIRPAGPRPRRPAGLETRLVAVAESLIGRVLATPTSRLVEMAGGAISGAETGGGPRAATDVVADFLRSLLGSREAIYAVRDIVARGVASLWRVDTGEALTRIDLEGFADRLLSSIAAEPRRGALSRAIAESLVDNAPRLLDDAALDRVAAVVEGFAPHAVDRLVAWVRTPRTREALAEQGRVLLPRILEKLNLLQRFLISAGQFDRRMTEQMPEIVDETIASVDVFLHDPEQQRTAVAALRDSVRDWRASLAGGGREKATTQLTAIVDGLLGKLGDPAVRGRIATLVRVRMLATYPTVGALARELAGEGETEIAERVSTRVLTLLTSPAAAKTVMTALGPTIDRPLGEILGGDVTLRKHIATRAVSGILDTMGGDELARPMRWVRVGGAVLGVVVGIIEVFVGIVLPSL